MALNYSKIDVRGQVLEEVMEDLIFLNDTLGKGYVDINEDIKANTIITEATANPILTAYASGAKSATGSLAAFDYTITPTKVQFYDEYDPETLRFSRFKRDMQPGAFNILSNEFERIMIGGVYAKEQSRELEVNFWSGITATTKAAIAAAGTASYTSTQLTKVAALTAGQVDGVLAKVLRNDINDTLTAGKGSFINVSGTASATATNIKDIFDLIYASIPAGFINNKLGVAHIYVPESWKSLINIFNNNPENFKFAFETNGALGADTEYYFNGLRICFVPFPENTVYVNSPKFVTWNTDLASDNSFIESDVIANNRKDRFYWSVMTLAAHISKQQYGVLYTF